MTYGCNRRKCDMTMETMTQGLHPEDAAERLFTAHRQDGAWLDRFAECLARRRAGESLARITDVWGLSQAEAARLFGVSRQAFGKWLRHGAPAERAVAVADLAAATDLLVRYLKRERIPAVVRRPVPALGGVSLMHLLDRGDTRKLLGACRDMFRFDRVHG